MRYLVLIPLAASAIQAQQAVPTRTLAKPELEYSEPFSQLVGLRELRDGRVIAADLRDKTLQAIDLTAKKATPIGREGSGPGEWVLPLRVFPMPGDSSLIFDMGNTRFLVVGPDARPVRVFSTIADGADGPGPIGRGDAAGRGGAGRGDAGRGDAGGRGASRGGDGRGGDARGGGGGRITIGGGGPSILSFSPPRAADARGRTYSAGVPLKIADDGTITSADSAPILRYDMVSKKTDTVAYVNLAKSSASGSIRGDASGRQEQNVSIGGPAPYAAADDWTVLADGRIVIARVSDYHVEVVQPGGRRIVGPAVRYTPVRVGEAEKQEWRDTQKRSPGMAMRVENNNGQTTRSMAPAAGNVQEPAAWPATKPPFSGGSFGAMWAAPNGETWITRTRTAKDNIPTADVFDGQGRLVGKVVLPERTRIAGFGTKGVYLVRLDDDDLQYLQRYAMTWTGCPAEMKESCR